MIAPLGFTPEQGKIFADTVVKATIDGAMRMDEFRYALELLDQDGVSQEIIDAMKRRVEGSTAAGGHSTASNRATANGGAEILSPSAARDVVFNALENNLHVILGNCFADIQHQLFFTDLLRDEKAQWVGDFAVGIEIPSFYQAYIDRYLHGETTLDGATTAIASEVRKIPNYGHWFILRDTLDQLKAAKSANKAVLFHDAPKGIKNHGFRQGWMAHTIQTFGAKTGIPILAEMSPDHVAATYDYEPDKVFVGKNRVPARLRPDTFISLFLKSTFISYGTDELPAWDLESVDYVVDFNEQPGFFDIP